MEGLRVGIVGAGIMGSGIAQLCAARGHAVRLYDVDPARPPAAADAIGRRLAREVERGRMDAAAAQAAAGRLRPARGLEELAQADMVIEAAPEDLALKRDLFARLGAWCRPGALLCTNTSSLSITAVAAAAARPGRVVGLHFFNPAPVMPLVELIAGEATDPDALDRADTFAAGLGKTVIRCKDTPGFIVNRVARPFYLEALRCLGEGVAPAEVADRIARGAGFPMGPFELLDLIGLDTNLAVTRAVYEASGHEPRYRPHPLQARMVAAGRLGRKAGRGFYAYDEPKGAAPA